MNGNELYIKYKHLIDEQLIDRYSKFPNVNLVYIINGVQFNDKIITLPDYMLYDDTRSLNGFMRIWKENKTINNVNIETLLTLMNPIQEHWCFRLFSYSNFGRLKMSGGVISGNLMYLLAKFGPNLIELYIRPYYTENNPIINHQLFYSNCYRKKSIYCKYLISFIINF